jgi:hypothetical protein
MRLGDTIGDITFANFFPLFSNDTQSAGCEKQKQEAMNEMEDVPEQSPHYRRHRQRLELHNRGC